MQGNIFPLPLHALHVHKPSQEMETMCNMLVTVTPSGPAMSTPAGPVAPLPRQAAQKVRVLLPQKRSGALLH